MIITLKDGSEKEYASPMSVIDIASDISEGLARAACAGEIDGKVVDLRTVVDGDCQLNILTANDKQGVQVVRHTASHVLAEAVKRLYPDAKLAIGPSIDTGFYYDFEHDPFSREDLDRLEAEMKKIIKEGKKLEKFTLPREEAMKFMEEKGEPYKVELIRDLPEDAVISFYQQGDFVDLCAGSHLMSTKGIKAFKLISSSGAYWRGNSDNTMLQRIYGTAFQKKEELADYLEYLENIKYYCLIMSNKYITKHFNDIKKYANVVENRMDDGYCTIETLLRDNARILEQCQNYHTNYILIDNEYKTDIELVQQL